MGHIDLPPLEPSPALDPRRLAGILRARRDDILRAWKEGVRHLPRARPLDEPTLVDHIPDLLDRIAQLADDLAGGHAQQLPKSAAERHALARLEEGFDVLEVIAEFRVLRRAILRACADPANGQVSVDELHALDDAIDAAIADSVERYTEIRDRTLQGFDRVATAAFESRTLDDLLRRLLQVFHDTTPAIDCSSIYLREGDILRMRAAVGLDDGAEARMTVRVGEGFAGRIAERRAALTLRRPTPDQVASERLGSARVRVVYGVPIFDGDAVIGVAKMGSLTADELSEQDQRIFAALVARASAAILQHSLREQAEEARARLAESERQFRTLADNIPQLAWMADPSGQRIWFNRRWYEYTGANPDEMHGLGWQRVHHPDHLARVGDSWRHALETGQSWEEMFPLRGTDGRYRWFLTRAVPIRDASGRIEHWFGTNTDVSARRFLDEATSVLNRSLDVRQTLEELAHLAVPGLADWCIVDLLEGDRLEHVAIVHADTRKVELARDFARRFPPDREHAAASWRILGSGEPEMVSHVTPEMLGTAARSEEHRRMLDAVGFTAWIGAPLVSRGHTIGVIHLIASDPQRRYGEGDLDVATELGQRAGVAVDNARLYRDAQQAIRMREEVLAIVSHDLRNPLGAIDIATSLLLQQVGNDSRARRHLEVVRRSTDRMTHLIGDLLDMASINAGKLAIEPTHADAERVIADAIDMHEPLAHERGISLLRDLDLKGAQIVVDRHRMTQVFGNLLGNALKFCQPGDVIMVRGVLDGERVRITLADTGPGIPSTDLPHIFEPYWSSHHGSRKKQGTGLGLFITKAIVEAHGGNITASSREGHGATFVITLPLARSDR